MEILILAWNVQKLWWEVKLVNVVSTPTLLKFSSPEDKQK